MSAIVEGTGGIESREAKGLYAYAAPAFASYFFYIPMWSILPGIYSKYFGLELTSVAAIVLLVRLFDGVSDLTVGYLSDRHRARGGSRKTWVVGGGVGTILACYFLFVPPQPATTTYYLIASLAYFLAFAAAEIPHLTWGSELTYEYQQRAQVYGFRNISAKLGIAAFYSLPLLPIFATPDYTPEVLRVALMVGAFMTAVGLVWAFFAGPDGFPVKSVRHDNAKLLFKSIAHCRPLLLFFAAATSGALAYGMWYGLLYLYFDSYLHMGDRLALMLLLGTVLSTFTTPLWLKLIRMTSKATAWAIGVLLFCVQLAGTWWIEPGDSWWFGLLLVLFANLCFTANDVAAAAAMGDIVDYGKLKFRVDRGATYFAVQNLIFKIGIGLGAGSALGIAGAFGFSASAVINTESAVWGLKLGFIVLPMFFAILCLLLVTRTPINRRRHRIIQRRIEARLLRSDT